MTHTIRASSLFVKRFLKIKDTGVIFMETAAMGGTRKFRFDQIDYILMSPAHMLSFQVGNEVFSIQTRPDKQTHTLAIRALRQAVGNSQEQAKGFPVMPGWT